VIEEDIDQAKQDMMLFYKDKRLPLKFMGRRHNPGYRPNTLKYEAQKRRQFGVKPQLVASGAAMGMILKSAKLEKRSKGYAITYLAPGYMGNKPREQIFMGRNWNAFNARDIRSMKRELMRALRKARKVSRRKI
jgi:hypothetical protein